MKQIAKNVQMSRHGLNVHRTGFTLIETLVVIAIISLLMGLLIVGVQSARESARRVSCVNNMRQIGIATQSYISAHGVFPGTYVGTGSWHSPLYGMLPQLGMGKYFDEQEKESGGVPHNAPKASRVTPEVLLCASDSAINRSQGMDGKTNYVFNLGTQGKGDGLYPLLIVGGFSKVQKPISVSDVRDGLATTHAFAETLPADYSGSRLRVLWYPDKTITSLSIDEIADFFKSLPNDPIAKGWLGSTDLKARFWSATFPGVTMFNHVCGPNQPSGYPGALPDVGDYKDGALTASSNHPGGVNVLFADGHVDFVQNGVDIKLWRSQGTINGRETEP